MLQAGARHRRAARRAARAPAAILALARAPAWRRDGRSGRWLGAPRRPLARDRPLPDAGAVRHRRASTWGRPLPLSQRGYDPVPTNGSAWRLSACSTSITVALLHDLPTRLLAVRLLWERARRCGFASAGWHARQSWLAWTSVPALASTIARAELVVDGKVIARDGPAYVIAGDRQQPPGAIIEKAKALVHAAQECGVGRREVPEARRTAFCFTRAFYDAPYDNENSFGPDVRRASRGARALDERLVQSCRRVLARRGIAFFATAFDEPSADLLARARRAGVQVRIGRPSATRRFLRYVAEFGKPMIPLDGRRNPGGRRPRGRRDPPARNEQLCVLHCTAAYPADVGGSQPLR